MTANGDGQGTSREVPIAGRAARRSNRTRLSAGRRPSGPGERGSVDKRCPRRSRVIPPSAAIASIHGAKSDEHGTSGKTPDAGRRHVAQAELRLRGWKRPSAGAGSCRPTPKRPLPIARGDPAGNEPGDEGVELVSRRHVEEVGDPSRSSVPVVPSVLVTIDVVGRTRASAGEIAGDLVEVVDGDVRRRLAADRHRRTFLRSRSARSSRRCPRSTAPSPA